MHCYRAAILLLSASIKWESETLAEDAADMEWKTEGVELHLDFEVIGKESAAPSKRSTTQKPKTLKAAHKYNLQQTV